MVGLIVADLPVFSRLLTSSIDLWPNDKFTWNQTQIKPSSHCHIRKGRRWRLARGSSAATHDGHAGCIDEHTVFHKLSQDFLLRARSFSRCNTWS